MAPVIVSGLTVASNGDSEFAGYVFAANMYGTALGGFLVSFFVVRLNWRRWSVVLLCLLIATDFLSAVADGDFALYALRFVHGAAGGALIGIGMSVIARVRNPEITFSLLLFVQLSLGGAGIALLMPLVAATGVHVVWFSLIGFSVLALVLIPLLPDYPVQPARRESGTEGAFHRAPWLIIALTLLAIFLFQTGEMSAFAYVIEVGLDHLIDPEFVNLSVAMSLWVGGPAALLVAWWSMRSGHLIPLGTGTSLMIGSISLLLFDEPWAYLAANIGFGIFFSLTLPYLFGLASELDGSGETAARAGFVSSLGLATGPAIAAVILESTGLPGVIHLALAILMASAFLILYPARLLDIRTASGRRDW